MGLGRRRQSFELSWGWRGTCLTGQAHWIKELEYILIMKDTPHKCGDQLRLTDRERDTLEIELRKLFKH